MARCCGSTCACKMEAGTHMVITGTGSAQDPFILSSDVDLTVQDNTTFDMSLSGSGTTVDPWILSVAFAGTAQLDDLPDVSDTAPTNGQVLAWNSSTQLWEPTAPTTAPTGAVNHDTSLDGDGSPGDPLQVQEDPARYLTTTASGLGLTDEAINQLVRSFVDSTARDAALPVPELNTISTLDSAPGQYDYWDGLAWVPIPDYNPVVAHSDALLELSGAYVAGSPVTQRFRAVSTTTSGTGDFDVLAPADLSGLAGVLTVMFQETGSLAWRAVVFGNTDRVSANAFRLSDGQPYIGQAITGTVTYWTY